MKSCVQCLWKATKILRRNSSFLVKNKPKNYWNSMTNVRNFLDSAASKLHLHDWSDWYNITLQDMSNIEGFSGLLSSFNCNFHQLLICAYPEYQWDSTRFHFQPRHFWEVKGEHFPTFSHVRKPTTIFRFLSKKIKY